MTTSNTVISSSVDILPIESIVPFILGNSRITRNQESRSLLRESIKVEGVISPITVRPSSDGGRYEVIAGFGRWEESKALGLASIPALIKDMDDTQAYEVQLAENLVRQDLTLVDEAKAAQKFVSLYEGDHTAAASRLGWTPKKLKERLGLLRCSESVLDALNTNAIKIAHAVILSSFSNKLQDGTLAKIIKEKWSVNTLKERAGRAKKYLHTAKFDTSDCTQCEHNTARQMGMFNTSKESQDQCAKLTCWNDKTTQWLSDARAKAEEKYGKVLLYIESSESDRNTVSPTLVGEEQFNACSGCESRVAIMDDRYGKEGEITDSQCLDKVCFSKCAKALSVSKDTVKKQQNSLSSKNAKSQLPSDIDKKVIQKTPASVTERERNVLRKAACIQVSDKAWFKQGIVLASLASSTGYKCHLFENALTFNARVLACASSTIDELQREILASVNHLSNTHNDESNTGKNPVDLLIGALSLSETSTTVAVSAWNADEETLKNYTVQGIVALCKEAKFDTAFDDDSGNQKASITFDKISKKSKVELIKSVLNFDFNWSGFAPKTMLEHIR